MSRTIFGIFWPFLTNFWLYISFEAIAKQFSWKNALGDFWAIFTHFRPFFPIFFSSHLKDFCLFPSFPANFLFKFGHSDGSKLQKLVFLDPPTLEVGTIDLPLSFRPSVRTPDLNIRSLDFLDFLQQVSPWYVMKK